MPGDHAKLSPSAAKRWLTCPASVEASANVVSPDTEHSLAGTAGHWAYAQWITTGSPVPVGTKAPNGVVIDEEMYEHVRQAVDNVQLYVMLASGPCTMLVEEKVQIGRFFGLDDSLLWGTADTIIMTPDELHIWDLKLGYVDVPAEGNPQLLLYTTGAAEELGWLWPKYRVSIFQPKQGGEKTYVYTKEQLQAWAEEQRPKVLEATQPNARYNPTEDACRWCPAAGVCRELQQHALALARQEFDTPVTLFDHVTPEELGLLLSKAKLIEAAVKAAREHAKKLIQCGQEVPGWKVVESRKDRIWSDEDGAKAELEKHGISSARYLTVPEFISPAQAEKLVPKDVLASFIEKPKGEPVLAPVTDKRPALAAHFDLLDTGDLLE